MTPKETPSKRAADLRKRAEAKARTDAVQTGIPMSPEEATRILHDLRVHQIELEMQNEELRRTQEELEASRARYFDLYDMAPVGYLTLSETGADPGSQSHGRGPAWGDARRPGPTAADPFYFSRRPGYLLPASPETL